MLKGGFVAGLLLAGTVAAQSGEWRGTWSATAKGLAISGGWTARAGTEPNTGTGAWTLYDHSGKTIAAGSWSARKAEKAWEGSWSARLPDGKVLSGKWATQAPLNPVASFTELFESAAKDVLSGTWQHGGDSGAWSIRTAGKR